MTSLLLFLAVTGINLIEVQPDPASIAVRVEGISNSSGSIAVLLFRSADGFPSDHRRAFRQVVMPAMAGSMVIDLGQVPEGRFAVSVMHDENNNLKLDANWMGIPREGYGFSGNRRSMLGPPAFADAGFDVQGRSLTLPIQMNY